MSNDKTGEAAFPLYGVSSIVQHGMTLRDYFAAHAPAPNQPMPIEDHCAYRYRYADAMLEARTHTAAQAATDQKG